MKKITFGKIQLNVNKDEKKQIAADGDQSSAASTSGNYFAASKIGFDLWFTKLRHSNIPGFGVFGRNERTKDTNRLNDEIEEIAEDLESQHVKEIMGISEFGKKAKSFDIIVSVCCVCYISISGSLGC